MKNHCLVRGRLNKLGLVAFIWSVLAVYAIAAQQPVAPTISVTINKSMVFRLAEKAKRVSVSQPAVADVLVVARPDGELVTVSVFKPLKEPEAIYFRSPSLTPNSD